MRFHYRYERADYDDWHYDNLPYILGAGDALFLGAGPRNYTDNLFGVFYQYTAGKCEKPRP